jgi:hypothetical protein
MNLTTSVTKIMLAFFCSNLQGLLGYDIKTLTYLNTINTSNLCWFNSHKCTHTQNEYSLPLAESVFDLRQICCYAGIEWSMAATLWLGVNFFLYSNLMRACECTNDSAFKGSVEEGQRDFTNFECILQPSCRLSGGDLVQPVKAESSSTSQ